MSNMLDYARPYDQAMCEVYPAPSAPGRLEDFQVFRKTTNYPYANYYPTYDYPEPELDTTVYHNLVSSRDCYRDSWSSKLVRDWNADDTVSWIIETVISFGYSEHDVPYYNFRVPGTELQTYKLDDVLRRMVHPNVDPNISRNIASVLYDKLISILNIESAKHSTVLRYADSADPYSQDSVQTMLDLDLYEKHKVTSDYVPNDRSILPQCDSSDETEDLFRLSESPEHGYGSDGSKSGDDGDKRKMVKRPPGRPKGSGRKICKRPRSVSVPEFLRNLLLDPKYCPSIIKWEDHSQGKFRFVKPDEVAKLWGMMKQNDNMTFEKFSRAMRYHYRQCVLVSVPTARLVYQFGSKGPDIKTDNPNFVKVKSELDIGYDSLYS